jgi:hypothetical protein
MNICHLYAVLGHKATRAVTLDDLQRSTAFTGGTAAVRRARSLHVLTYINLEHQTAGAVTLDDLRRQSGARSLHQTYMLLRT